VDAHAYAQVGSHGPVAGAERPLRVHRGADRLGGAGERGEEGVAFRVDLPPAVLGERRAQQAPVLREDLAVPAAQPRQQARRALDVGEQERDGATRKLGDSAELRPNVAFCQGSGHRGRPVTGTNGSTGAMPPRRAQASATTIPEAQMSVTTERPVDVAAIRPFHVEIPEEALDDLRR
jgi:hypothetical protein